MSQLVIDLLGIPGRREHGTKEPLRVRLFRQAVVNDLTGCWEWTGAKTPHGYGIIGLDDKGPTRRAHRVSYEMLREPIPQGLNIDHLCKNPSCINPQHLEPVTQGENVKRGRAGWHNKIKTHCVNGHEFTPENTLRVRGTEQRQCRTCRDKRIREFRARQRANKRDAA
jgi:hypothetical protein